MDTAYQLYLTNDYGKRLQNIDYSLGFTASRIDGDIGILTLDLPQTFNTNYLRRDFGVQVWRAFPGGQLSLFQHYFIRKWRFTTQGADEFIRVWGKEPKDLLRRRVIAHYAGEAESGKTDYADDMMKEIVSEMITDGTTPAPVDGTRVWNDLAVQEDMSAGPTLTKDFAWQKVLSLLQTIQKASREAGTEVFFDIVPKLITDTSIDFQFRTYTGQPGASRTNVVFAQEFGNMSNPFYEFDAMEEENYVYSGGLGQRENRNIQQVYDTDRCVISQWNRCESFAQASQQSSDNGVREVGRSKLEAGRPRHRFGADAIDRYGTRFGKDWDFGYRVTARYRNRSFESIIRAVTISVTEDNEDISARLEYES